MAAVVRRLGRPVIARLLVARLLERAAVLVQGAVGSEEEEVQVRWEEEKKKEEEKKRKEKNRKNKKK